MVGQGRPSPSLLARARDTMLMLRALVACCFSAHLRIALGLCALWTLASVPTRVDAEQNEPPPEAVRVRITWGGGESTAWHGRIWLDKGGLSNLKLLSLAADAAGSIWLDNGHLRIRSLSAHETDAVDVAAETADAQLFVELSPGSSPAGAPVVPLKLPLADILRRPVELRLDDRGNTLKVEHLPADVLGITLDRETLILAPSEQLAVTLHPKLPDMDPGTTLDVHTRLFAGRVSDAIWTDSQRLEVPFEGRPTVTIHVPMPRVEGAYTVRVSASRPPGFRPRFFPGGTAPMAERSLDVVVIDPNPPRENGQETWETVLEIDPTSPGWWDRLPTWTQLRRIPGLNFKQIGSIRPGAIDLPYGRFVELPASVPGSDPHWQAYSLPLEAVGAPHLLEVEYPAGGDQQFSLSIIEPNAAGIVEEVCRDSGVYVEGFGRRGVKQTHRMVFWPRTQAPMLLVTNQYPTGAVAHFGHIRVLKRSTPQLTTATIARDPSDRLVAAYFARPMLPETFGATKTVGKSAGHAPSMYALDDWQTYYESATRLSEYLRYSGYNCAVVNALADGSAIYPSRHVGLTPRYNSGRAASDAIERDALELMMQVFDRDGLALVPALQLASPIPALEQLRRAENPQASGLEWVGPSGKTWLEVNGSQNGLAPYYNLLDTRVQQSILQVVSELIERYGRHAAFAGLSIQLSANGYAQLPPLDWGFDDATIAQFQRDTGVQINAAGASRFAVRHALLTGEHAEKWRDWRAQRVANFYVQLATLIRESSEAHDRKLILTFEESFSHPVIATRVRPKILEPSRVEEALLDAGIDRAQLQDEPGVVVCATRYVESMVPLAKRAIDLELNDAFATWHAPPSANAVSAALLYHRSERQSLSSFESQAVNLKFGGEFGIRTQPSPHAEALLRPYARALVQHDPAIVIDGGDTLSIATDDSLRRARDLIRQLPTGAKVSEVSKQPVTLRTYAEADGVTLLAVNGSAWATTVDVVLEVPQATRMSPLATLAGPQEPAKRNLAAGRQPWKLTLAPYGIEAVRIDAPGVRVAEVNVMPSQLAKDELSRRIADLANRDLTAPRTYTALTNPSFEPVAGAGTIAGWHSTAASLHAQLDATEPRFGTSSVYIRNSAGFAGLESDPFPIPPTGQLAMTVWLRSQKMAAGSELRMVIESEQNGQLYRRSALIAPTDAPPTQWLSKAILVNDLPLELRGDMRVRFELTGPGEVWLDDVVLYDLLFPLKFYKFDETEILQFLKLNHVAKAALEEGRIVDAERTLERYWPRFLFSYTPMIQPAIAAPPVDTPQPLAAPPEETEQPAPSISEHIKRVFPFMK